MNVSLKQVSKRQLRDEQARGGYQKVVKKWLDTGVWDETHNANPFPTLNEKLSRFGSNPKRYESSRPPQ